MKFRESYTFSAVLAATTLTMWHAYIDIKYNILNVEGMNHAQLSVFAVSTNTAHPGTKPTLPELIKFTCTDRRVLNIPVEIGTKYISFGALLLDDCTGARVKNMAHKCLNDAEPINTEILQQWLDERGKQPVTWAALVEVLRDIELSTLAGEIEAVKCPARPVTEDIPQSTLYYHATKK